MIETTGQWHDVISGGAEKVFILHAVQLLQIGGAKTRMAPELVQINRLPAKATYFTFPDDHSARSVDRTQSPWFQSLNGTWDFHLAARPEDVPEAFIQPDFDAPQEGWAKLPVPSNWTMHSFDRPHYTNIHMPFPHEPPRVPDDNPTGLYRTRFELAAEWAGRRIVLHFGGAESVLYVNGHLVGMSKDTRLPAEFDITPFVQPGANTLAAVVVKRSWSNGPMPASSRIRISGGWAASTATFTSMPPARLTSPMCFAGPNSMTNSGAGD